jgi:outer membrane protein TolC
MLPAMPFRHIAALAAASLLVLPAAADAQATPARPLAPAPARAAGDTIVLTLPDAVTRALRTGEEVRLAATQLEVTEAQVTTARSGALPQLRVQGGYTQVLANARAEIVGSVFAQNYNYNANANLSLPVFQGGRAVGAIQGARALRAASTEELAEVRAQVAVDVQRSYLNALAADELVRIQERNLALAAERLTQVEQFERAGRAARYDVLRARVERTNLEPLLIQARNDREVAYLDVRRLLNLPIDRPLRLASQLGTDSAAVLTVIARSQAQVAGAAVAPGTEARGTGTAGERDEPVRAALRGAQATVEARRAGVKVARADFLPTVNVFFQGGVLALPSSPRFPTALGQTGNQFCPAGSPATRLCQNNGFFADRSAGVQVSWPLFDGLRAKGNLDLASAQARNAELQLAQVRERVEVEEAQARAGVTRAAALWTAQRSNVREAEEAFALATLRFQRGLGTQLEVSDAQLALLTARTNALRATFDVYVAAAELARSQGRPIPLPE